jgi:hypothetical protein
MTSYDYGPRQELDLVISHGTKKNSKTKILGKHSKLLLIYSRFSTTVNYFTKLYDQNNAVVAFTVTGAKVSSVVGNRVI